MNGRGKAFLLCATALLCVTVRVGKAHADELTLFGAASTSFASLAVPAGVRAIGMGEAYTAAGDDVYSLHWNPSGLARMSSYELGLEDNEWDSSLGVRQELLTYGQKLGPSSGLGVALNYFALGTLVGRAPDGTQLDTSSPYSFGGTAGYGWSMLSSGRLKLGLALEFTMENLFSQSQSNIGGSAGLGYDIWPDLSAGLSLNHIGNGIDGFSPPSSVSLGMAAWFLKRSLLLALDGSVPFSSEPMLNAGAEMDFGVLQLRGGYRLALGAPEGDQQSGLTAGAGFKVGHFTLDYAFVPYGAIANVHRISLTMQLASTYFEPLVVGADGSTTTAMACFKQGIIFETEGKPIEAMVQYQMVENDYPEDMEDHPQNFYLQAQARMISIQQEMEKKGATSTDMKVFIQLHMKSARDFINAGRFKDARQEIRQVEAFDKTSNMVVKLRNDMEAGLAAHIERLRNKARSEELAQHLAAAVESYRKIQGVLPSDTEASAFFAKRHAEIIALLKSIYYKGIDLYVAGKWQEAVDVWNSGKAIDIDNGQTVDFDRDIQRAKLRLRDSNSDLN